MGKVAKLIDASILVTIITGLLYLFGYHYFVSFYAYFSINLSLRKPEIEYILVFGARYIHFILIIVLTVLILHVVFKFISNKMVKINNYNLERIIYALEILVLAVFVVTVLNIMLKSITVDGNQAAHIFANPNNSKKASIIFTDGKYFEQQPRFLFYNDKNYVFFITNEDPTKEPKTLIIKEERIKYIGIN